MKVLVVEDDNTYRELLGISLRSSGFETVLAENGARALSLLPEVEPDAIVADVLMPVMDGLRFLNTLRNDLKSPVPVIFLTCLDSRSFAAQALVAGARDVLTKPVDLDVLLEKLAAIGGQQALEAKGEP